MPPRRRRRRHPRPPSPSSSSSSSSTSLKEFREQVYYTVFPEGRPYRDLVGPPPSPPYSNSSFIVPPNRPSRPQPCVIHPHPLFPGVFVAADHDHDESCNKVLYTRNLVPGVQSRDQDDVVFSVQVSFNLCIDINAITGCVVWFRMRTGKQWSIENGIHLSPDWLLLFFLVSKICGL